MTPEEEALVEAGELGEGDGLEDEDTPYEGPERRSTTTQEAMLERFRILLLQCFGLVRALRWVSVVILILLFGVGAMAYRANDSAHEAGESADAAKVAAEEARDILQEATGDEARKQQTVLLTNLINEIDCRNRRALQDVVGALVGQEVLDESASAQVTAICDTLATTTTTTTTP